MHLFSVNVAGGGGSGGTVLWGQIGGTLSNQLDLQAALNAKISTAGSSTDNAHARWNGTSGNALQDGKWIEDDDGRLTVNIGDTSSGTTYGTRVTATLTGGAGTINAVERWDVTTAGSGAGAFVLGRWVRLLSGYTGGGMCAGDWVINNCASTGTDLNGGGGNMGYRSVMGSSTTGYVAAYYGDVSGTGTRTFGALMELEGGPSSGVQVGYATSVNPGSGTVKVACFYGKLTATPGQAPNTSAVAVFDNATTTLPGLVVEDNGTTSFQVADGGIVTLGASSTTPTHILNTSTGTPAADVLTLTNGPTGTAGNPDAYILITVNGTNAYIPIWNA